MLFLPTSSKEIMIIDSPLFYKFNEYFYREYLRTLVLCAAGIRHNKEKWFYCIRVSLCKRTGRKSNPLNIHPYDRTSTKIENLPYNNSNLRVRIKIIWGGYTSFRKQCVYLSTPPTYISCTLIVHKIILSKSIIPRVSISDKKISLTWVNISNYFMKIIVFSLFHYLKSGTLERSRTI